MSEINKKEIASMIDHTILKPDATGEQVIRLCKEALDNGFASVCVNPCHVNLAASLLKGSDVKTCVVVGFPLGANTTETKVFETKKMIEAGAQEIDMVINVGALKSRDSEYVSEEIRQIVQAADGKTVKVIIETCLLTDDEKVLACRLSKEAGAAFVKTSTGFSAGGATTADIALMRKTVGNDIKIKASGGVKTLADAVAMINAGADRIGTSSGVAIISEII